VIHALGSHLPISTVNDLLTVNHSFTSLSTFD
jgi:hypothetical protein